MSLARLIFAPACVADAVAARASRGTARAVIVCVAVADPRARGVTDDANDVAIVSSRVRL